MAVNISESSSKPLIHVQDLTKDFGKFRAVDQISFQVYPGEIFGFLGPNGSGKTTSIRMMLGLLQPSSGQVEVLGSQVADHSIQIRSQIGYMSQKFSLYNDLTVLQNLNFYGVSYGLTNTQLSTRIEEAIAMAGLTGKEDSLTRDLAGGWRQRLALSAAILHQPRLLFLDEPTSGVDPVSRRAFWDLLYKLSAGGTTIFVTTHYMDEAEHCHRLAFIQRGKIIAIGSPEQIKKENFPWSVLELISDDPISAMKEILDAQEKEKLPVENVELYGSSIHIVTDKPKNSRKKIKQILGRKIGHSYKFSEISPTLEDVFISTMKRFAPDD